MKTLENGDLETHLLCCYCQMEFDTMKKLNNHIMEEHFEEYIMENLVHREQKPDYIVNGTVYQQCGHCPKFFPGDFLTHIHEIMKKRNALKFGYRWQTGNMAKYEEIERAVDIKVGKNMAPKEWLQEGFGNGAINSFLSAVKTTTLDVKYSAHLKLFASAGEPNGTKTRYYGIFSKTFNEFWIGSCNRVMRERVTKGGNNNKASERYRRLMKADDHKATCFGYLDLQWGIAEVERCPLEYDIIDALEGLCNMVAVNVKRHPKML